MQYKLTFEDGSDGYLAHHGIKGMKWGVWNEETRARRMGGTGERRTSSSKTPLLSDRQKAMLKAGLAGTAIVGGAAVATGLVQAFGLKGVSDLTSTAQEIIKQKYDADLKTAGTALAEALKSGKSGPEFDKLVNEANSKLASKERAQKHLRTMSEGAKAVLTYGGTAVLMGVNQSTLEKTIKAGGGMGFYNQKKKKQTSNDPFQSRTVKTKNGETLTLERNTGGPLAKGLQKISPAIRRESNLTYNYDMKTGGKKVGSLQMYQKKNGEMNVTWGSTKEKYRNKGYMSAALSEGEKIAKELGNTKITGELVGNSPGGSIHKIANNQGWVKTGENRTKAIMDTWGGLTYVEKKL